MGASSNDNAGEVYILAIRGNATIDADDSDDDVLASDCIVRAGDGNDGVNLGGGATFGGSGNDDLIHAWDFFDNEESRAFFDRQRE